MEHYINRRTQYNMSSLKARALSSNRCYVWDVETNGLYPYANTVWCNHLLNIGTQHAFRADNTQRGRCASNLHLASPRMKVLIGHNIINYDLPVSAMLGAYGVSKECLIVDTLVWARLACPDITKSDVFRVRKGFPKELIGKHSLKAWGYRLGLHKGVYGEEEGAWAEWTQELSDYCVRDLEVTRALFLYLLEGLDNPSSKVYTTNTSLTLEHNVAHIISRQEKFGCPFNIKEGRKLAACLSDDHDTLLLKIQETVEGTYKQMKKPAYYVAPNNKRYLTIKEAKQVGWSREQLLTGAPEVRYTPFNPASRTQIYKYFMDKYGWKPTVFTSGGKDKLKEKQQPKVDEEILKALPYPEAQLIAQYMLLQKRIGQIVEGDNAWLACVNEETGRIYGSINTNGAVSGRFTHYKPNMSQVPRVSSPYGKEMRSLFYAPEGMVFVGADASGLEARTLGHYLSSYDNGAFAHRAIHGSAETHNSIHCINASILGCTRDTAKTWWYAWQYGAGVGKLASILGCSVGHAQQLNKAFLQKNPAIKKLKEAIGRQITQRGYLIGLDGRRLYSRSEHSVLNLLCQSAGALIMKMALVLLDYKLTYTYGYKQGLDYEFVLNSHDEWQIACIPEYAEIIGNLSIRAMAKAGQMFKFKVPITGEYAIGHTWAETH